MPPPPLPILATVIAAYTSLFEEFLAFVHIAAGWWILTVIAAVSLSSLAETVAQMQVTVAATIVTFTIGAIAAAVSWHRLIVLRERPSGPLPIKVQPWLDYFLRSLLLAAAA